MQSLKTISQLSIGRTLTADDMIEFHASRLLLLIMLCGVRNRTEGVYTIEGLTKLAKLDFFVRYPAFFQRVATHLNAKIKADDSVPESKMIRFHYGPWDKRYYQILPYLEARGLLEVMKVGNTYNFSLTQKGAEIGKTLKDNPSFEALASRMHDVKRVLGGKTGTALKDLVYQLFEEEVADKKLNTPIG
ncbi:hypothetical protein [Hymenobacter terrenus]|uniref:hypothetical protein n=1 Tax=Hymenobacter terrenus TaxID=1629124 RepID=UPI0006198331|nr:hypothetical protein [Hymenobacter terrenus]